MRVKLKKEVGKDQTALLIVPDEIYRKTLADVVKQAAKGYKRILYVTLNEPYDVLAKDFKDRKIPLDKFYFIDARTAVSNPSPRPVKNCTFVSSPEALTELKIAITKGCERHKPEIVVLDSVSTLLSYLSDWTITRWMHDVIIKFKESNTAAVLLCLKRDEKSFLVKDISMFVGKIIHLIHWGR